LIATLSGESELVDVVDENDNPIFVATLDECKSQGLLHRSVAVFLRNSEGEILLQQRSLNDDWMPGKWTASSTGHVRAGEDPRVAASRELKEELGITASTTFIFSDLLPKISWQGKTEHELAFAFDAISNAEICKDPVEVEQTRFFSPDECASLVANHQEELTPDGIRLLQKYLLLSRIK